MPTYQDDPVQSQTDTNSPAVIATSSAAASVLAESSGGPGVIGKSTEQSASACGVYGSSTTGSGVYGTSPLGTGVTGMSTNGWAVQGISYGQNGLGVIGVGYAGTVGVYAFADGGDNPMGVYAEAIGTNPLALVAAGDATVAGHLSKSSGSFRIDHPLDPANKYLYHSFVESPDMMNVYNGNVILGSDGKATVGLPDWFEALNRDFRYQLTSIGSLDPTCISRKISDGSFEIMGSPQQEVSWQVTGIRKDAWANAHRVPLEVEKKTADRGRYLHPELFEGEPIEEIARGKRYRQRLPNRPESA